MFVKNLFQLILTFTTIATNPSTSSTSLKSSNKLCNDSQTTPIASIDLNMNQHPESPLINKRVITCRTDELKNAGYINDSQFKILVILNSLFFIALIITTYIAFKRRIIRLVRRLKLVLQICLIVIIIQTAVQSDRILEYIKLKYKRICDNEIMQKIVLFTRKAIEYIYRSRYIFQVLLRLIKFFITLCFFISKHIKKLILKILNEVKKIVKEFVEMMILNIGKTFEFMIKSIDYSKKESIRDMKTYEIVPIRNFRK